MNKDIASSKIIAQEKIRDLQGLNKLQRTIINFSTTNYRNFCREISNKIDKMKEQVKEQQ